MADSKPSTITIPFELPRDEATALAQFVKRIHWGTCSRFASRTTTYDGRSEADVMWSAVCMLQNQLAEAGFAPR
jgi:hypothetical protein